MSAERLRGWAVQEGFTVWEAAALEAWVGSDAERLAALVAVFEMSRGRDDDRWRHVLMLVGQVSTWPSL